MAKMIWGLADILKNAEPSDFFEKVKRRHRVAMLKERYDREYLMKHNMCTKEEYDTIPASTYRRDQLRKMRDWSKINSQVVGAEYDNRG